MLVVREADDPRQAAGGSERVPASEPLDAEHSQAALREVIGRGAAVRAEADDDGVKALRHPRTLRPVAACGTMSRTRRAAEGKDGGTGPGAARPEGDHEYAGKLRDVLPLHILEQSDKEDLARQMHVRHFKADEVIYH